jgi:fucose permease
MLLCTSGAVIALTCFMYLGDLPSELFFALLMTHFFNFALITLTVGPLSAESVPASLMASASGLVICVGEVFGGGIAPVIAGFVAQRFGIKEILPLAIGALIIGFLNSCMLRETAPRRTQRSLSDNANQRFATPPL